MPLFVAIFEKPITPEQMEKAQTGLASDAFQIGDRAMVIQSPADDPQALSVWLDLTGESSSPHTGVLFKLNGSYYGHYYSGLWDWLREHRP